MKLRLSSLVVGVDGLGYMGLATGLAFAAKGWSVIGFDINPEVRTAVAQARSPYSEAGLAELLRSQTSVGRFRLVDSVEELARASDVVFMCLPTPSKPSGRIDLKPIRTGCDQLGLALRSVPRRRLIVVKSTVVPGTTERVVGPIIWRASRKGSDKVAIASNPEFLAEGTMVQDALQPDRAVIGTSGGWSRRLLTRLYAPFHVPVLALTPSGAELVKYSSNTFLAMKVTFANEISRLAEQLDVNVDDVMGAVGEDARIGRRFLRAGPGFGGSCFDKDIRALVTYAADRGLPFRLGRATLRANADRIDHIRDLVRSVAPSLNGKRIAVLGLAFKPGTDDVRESRAFPLIEMLLEEGAAVQAHDPAAVPRFRREWARLHPRKEGRRPRFSTDVLGTLARADLAILHTDWPEYRRWSRAWTSRMTAPIVIDLRRGLSCQAPGLAGVRVISLGVGGSPPTGLVERST
ncbi:MAG: UDP-glucose/GDP-mannose dehydrogenase family protein [Thermoplasmata archaeon]